MPVDDDLPGGNSGATLAMPESLRWCDVTPVTPCHFVPAYVLQDRDSKHSVWSQWRVLFVPRRTYVLYLANGNNLTDLKPSNGNLGGTLARYRHAMRLVMSR